MKGLLKYFIILVFEWETNVLYVLVYCWDVSSYLLLTCCKVFTVIALVFFYFILNHPHTTPYIHISYHQNAVRFLLELLLLH